MNVIRTDRSRIITSQRCARARWLEYHEQQTGITSVRKPLPLAVGGAVHSGMEVLLRRSMNLEDQSGALDVEENAVAAALADFAQFAAALDAEQTDASAASEVYTPEQVAAMRSDFDKYIYAEQSALVEAMVRAYARRRLRPLLEEFEVLEVEREGEWTLHDSAEVARAAESFDTGLPTYGNPAGDAFEIRFMSRPDALLRHRASNDLYILSFKTAASWDVRKARDAEHDMQGLSEGVEVERRLAAWWNVIKGMDNAALVNEDAADVIAHLTKGGCGDAMRKFLAASPAPPRILAIRYEFLLKGERWRDKDLSARFGFDARSQKSHLVRAYANLGMASGDEQWNWSWDYLKPDGAGKSNLYYKTWKAVPVWQHMTIREWIDKLDSAQQLGPGSRIDTDLDPRSLDVGAMSGTWKCAAQATGTTESHPLDAVFLPPLTVYRQDDDLRDWIEQTEAAETRIAEAVALVDAAPDEGLRRHALNVLFPQSRHSCEYPSTCQFVRVCYGSDDIRRDPLGSGVFKRRVPNHPAEAARERGA